MFVFILVIQFSSGNLLGDELMKVPLLIHHFNLYRSESSEGSFFEFLRLHYADAAHRKSDPFHQKLPLQTISTSSLSFVLPPALPFPRMQVRLDESNKNLPQYDEALLPSDFRTRLLRPPRV